MPGILKIGMTMRTPEDRARELSTTGVPTLFKIEFAKRVSNPKQKELTLHRLLSQYTERINPKREFFRISVEEVKAFFDLIDGEQWIKISNEDEDEEEEEEKISHMPASAFAKSSPVKGYHDISKCFTNGQRIRHTIGVNKTWIGIYDSSKNGIICDGKFYKSLSGFAKTHYSIDITDRVRSANGWKECECEVNGEWISTHNL